MLASKQAGRWPAEQENREQTSSKMCKQSGRNFASKQVRRRGLVSAIKVQVSEQKTNVSRQAGKCKQAGKNVQVSMQEKLQSNKHKNASTHAN